jgi:hypothetical protein|tara:strand:- start:3713 stop:3898 length:186 start_codon:yes stop_codon:yes gene_type:complete
MSDNDKVFAGSIPEFYYTYLVPLIFEAYADDLAERTAALAPEAVWRLRRVAAWSPAPWRRV